MRIKRVVLKISTEYVQSYILMTEEDIILWNFMHILYFYFCDPSVFSISIFIQCWPSLLHLTYSPPPPPSPNISIPGLYLLYPTIYCILRQYSIINIICIPCLPYAIFYPFLTTARINLGVHFCMAFSNLPRNFTILKFNIIISLNIKMLFSDAFSFSLSLNVMWGPQSWRKLKLQNCLGYINYRVSSSIIQNYPFSIL